MFVISLSVCSLAVADTITATIHGNACNLCAAAIEKTFRAQPEVKSVDVDLENRVVTIETKRGQTMDDAKMKKLLADAGYAMVTVARKKQ
jgi:copper chaperone CopZ